MSDDVIRVCVGCTESHWLAVKVLEHSIRCRTTARVEVYPMHEWELHKTCPIPKDRANRPVTEFSFQRFLPPEHFGFQGKAIYLDSDQVVMGDIAEMWNTPFNGAQVLKTPGWQTAVMLIDCTVGWRISKLVRQLDQGKRSYGPMVNLKDMGIVKDRLDPYWNYMDRGRTDYSDWHRAKLIHYTNMNTQPWLLKGHPLAEPWAVELLTAVQFGFITKDDVRREIELRHVRPSLAMVVGEDPPYSDDQFVFPDDTFKGKGLHR